MKNKRIILVVASMLSLLFATTPVHAIKGSTVMKKGWVGVGGKVSHSITCKPGEAIRVELSSEKTTHVSIVFKKFENGRWGERLVASSKGKTKHLLTHRAPTAQNRVGYQYDVRVVSSPNHQSKYTITIR